MPASPPALPSRAAPCAARRAQRLGVVGVAQASGLHGAGLIMGDHLARSVRGLACAPPLSRR